jgi:urease accessory protein
MRRAVAHHLAGTWPWPAEAGTVTLAFDDRHRRRLVLRDDAAEPFMLDLPRAAVLAEGDGLELEGGTFLRVRAAPEELLEVRPSSAAHAARLAWHLGNRHTPVQVLDDGRLRMRPDHVLEAMVRGLGAAVTDVTAPFHPEIGAYAHGRHGHEE